MVKALNFISKVPFNVILSKILCNVFKRKGMKLRIRRRKSYEQLEALSFFAVNKV